MGDKSAIQWTDATWNPIAGCTRVSAGCDNCYAARLSAGRLKDTSTYRGLAVVTPSGRAAFNGQIRLLPERLDQPLRWRRPRRVFVNSMSDLFHEGVPDEFIDQVFAVMALAPQHVFQVLTKRPERASAYLTEPHGGYYARQRIGLAGLGLLLDNPSMLQASRRHGGLLCTAEDGREGEVVQWPLPHVWLGTSVEDQAAADERIPHLLRTPAAVRFLSCEPLIGPINFRWQPYAEQAAGEAYREYLERNGSVNHFESLRGIHWCIVGGESGPGARPMDPEWARSLRDQCGAAGVPYFFKQVGGRTPKAGGRILDGREWNEMPLDAEGT